MQESWLLSDNNIPNHLTLTTHYLDEAEFLSDRVSILHHGQIQITDTVKNIIKKFKTKNLEDAFISFLDEKDKKVLYNESTN